jgi:hypothetical protein
LNVSELNSLRKIKTERMDLKKETNHDPRE